jgi:cytochrome c-type biogenesis protein CcmH
MPSRLPPSGLAGRGQPPTGASGRPRLGSAARGWLPAMALVVLAAVVVAGLAQGRTAPRDRAEALAARLRCPDCQSISVAESDSQTAQAIRAEIARQLAAGRSDQQVLDYFVARYGRWVLLDPPPRGATLLLWLLPVAALAAGMGVLVGYRRRARSPAQPHAQVERTDGGQAETEAEAEVEVQAGAGSDGRGAPPAPPGRSGRRILAGALAGVLALAITAFGVTRALVPRPAGGYVTGIEAAQAGQAPAGGRDLSKVSDAELEAVVAANPEVLDMRLALAHRYFDRQDYRKALEHYKVVLDREPDPEALAHVGWITYVLLGRADLAAALLQRSLRGRPGDPEALWFLGTVQLHGLKDAKAAAATLTRLRGLPGLTAAQRRQVDGVLRTARAAEGRR